MQRIVVVGARAAVQAHADRYERFDDATVCGVVGGAAESGDDGSEFGSIDAPTHDSLLSALRADDVDGVDICGPGSTFGNALETALDAGIPTRCDPPFALSQGTYDRVVSLATESSGWLLSHSPHRLSRLYDRLHSAVESGGIGSIGVARIERTAPFSGPGWNVSYVGVSAVESHVDALCAVLAHDVDVLEWTFGPIERVFVRMQTSEGCDHAHAVFAFREGGRATVETRWHRSKPPDPRVDVDYSGNHGRLDFDESDASTALREAEASLAVNPLEDDCRGRALRSFLDHLQDADLPPSDVAPATPSRVVAAARRSADGNIPVTIVEGSP